MLTIECHPKLSSKDRQHSLYYWSVGLDHSDPFNQSRRLHKPLSPMSSAKYLTDDARCKLRHSAGEIIRLLYPPILHVVRRRHSTEKGCDNICCAGTGIAFLATCKL